MPLAALEKPRELSAGCSESTQALRLAAGVNSRHALNQPGLPGQPLQGCAQHSSKPAAVASAYNSDFSIQRKSSTEQIEAKVVASKVGRATVVAPKVLGLAQHQARYRIPYHCDAWRACRRARSNFIT